jgi:hypothetical protein
VQRPQDPEPELAWSDGTGERAKSLREFFGAIPKIVGANSAIRNFGPLKALVTEVSEVPLAGRSAIEVAAALLVESDEAPSGRTPPGWEDLLARVQAAS